MKMKKPFRGELFAFHNGETFLMVSFCDEAEGECDITMRQGSFTGEYNM
jgi:hypothetical protein